MSGNTIIAGAGLSFEAVQKLLPREQLMAWLRWAHVRVKADWHSVDDELRELSFVWQSSTDDQLARALQLKLLEVKRAAVGEGDLFAEAKRVLYVYGGLVLGWDWP